MERLHPRLAAVLRAQGWERLTQAQEAAFPPLAAGQHVLLVAPTGHGKTEAALLPVLGRILQERDALEAKGKPWPTGFKAIYVTPLRALNRDLMRRLESWAEGLDLKVGVRHGDTTPAERTRQSKSPPDVLITTPETLQLLLYGDTLRRHLATVRFVIVDEVHDLAQSERGAQMLVALERIEEAIAQPAAVRDTKAPERDGPAHAQARPGGGFQRVGLSATVADPRLVARWLGGREREVHVVTVEARKRIELGVAQPPVVAGDEEMAGEFAIPPEAVAQMRAVRGLVEAHERVLVFHNTRDGAELLASRSALLDPEGAPLLGLHHGSLSPEHRVATEEAFKDGRLRGLVATSSLELGIDVGAIDHVVQVSSPRSVARLVQRLGRSGHFVAGVSRGTLLANGPEDLLECAAVARRAMEGRLEPLQTRQVPLVVLANQLVAMTNEYRGLQKAWCWEVASRAGCFLELDEPLFDAVWDCLLEVRTLFPDDERPDRIARSGRARKHFLDHISLIPDEKTYRVLDEATKRSIGTVDEAFVVASMASGSLIVMAGQSWRVLEVEPESARVRVAPVKELGPVPQWTGSQLPVSFDVAQEVARLRRAIVEDDKPTLASYPLKGDALALAAAPIQKHAAQGLKVPTDRLVTLDVDRRQVVAGVALGTRGNETLGRITQGLLSQRLGAPVGMDCDAYRILFTLPGPQPASLFADVWTSLDPPTIGLLLSMLLRESPLLRHHLVHVAKHFGALPKELDPNKMGRGRLDALMEHLALEEETLDRLIHDRMDTDAVAWFVTELKAGNITWAAQAQGPLTHLGREEMRRLMTAPRSDDALLAAVRKRIEDSDALLACCSCGNSWQSLVRALPRKIACRRCQSVQVAVLRPWNEDKVPLLRSKAKLEPEQQAERERIVRNGAIVASFGPVAARCLVARGIGPDTAARILQKVSDIESPAFWREILQAELTFARTNAYWAR